MKITKFLCAVLAFALSLTLMVGAAPASETAPQLTPYESFDNYDTLLGRNGSISVFDQMITWSESPMGFACELGDPIGVTTGRSLRITQKNNKQSNAWANGTKDLNLLDQSGSKYVRVSVRNLSKGGAKELIVYVTDITQSTIDANQTNDPNVIIDAGQEHWLIKWNQSAVLEPLGGEKSIVKSTLGGSVSIPANFEGYLYLPLNTTALEQPGWWIAEGHDYRNDVIDLDKMFAVSFGFTMGSDIQASDPNSWTVFELDDVCFGKDSSIDDFIKSANKQNSETESSVIRPNTTEGIEVDFDDDVITLNKEVKVSEFKAMFDLKQGFTINVLKNDFALSDFEVIPNESAVEFTNGEDTFVMSIVYDLPQVGDSSSTPDSSSANSGGNTTINNYNCGGSIGAVGFVLPALALASAFVILRKKNG